jgi:hypothetical protein
MEDLVVDGVADVSRAGVLDERKGELLAHHRQVTGTKKSQ